MALTAFKPRHLKRYHEISRLLRYMRSDLWKGASADLDLEPFAGPSGTVPDEAAGDAGVQAEAERLAADLEALGPTFIKLGQLLSTRAELLPVPYLKALARLQDRVEPFPFEQVEAIVAAELGVRLSKAFSEFEPTPLAAASLAQVHRAALRDGRPVAVKVQRPDVRERIAEDLEVLAQIAELLDRYTELGKRHDLSRLLAEFKTSLLCELDYRQEARNLETLSANLAGFDRIVVPLPVADYTTSRVLTMDLVRGRKVTELTPLVRLDIDGAALAEELFSAYLKQFLVDGFFHADPHPGNVFLTGDGRLALIDLGMVGRVSAGLAENLLKLLLAISEGRGEEVAEIAQRIGRPLETFDEAEFRRRIVELVVKHQGATMADLQMGKLVLDISIAAGEGGIRTPPELSMLGKALLNLDEVGRTLDPELDPNAVIRRRSMELMRQSMLKSASPGHLFKALIEAKEFAEMLPGRINRILQRIADNDLRVQVDSIDERLLMAGFQKVANRITMGLVLAALIVGAAMLMRVDTPFRILGYPGLAILLFLAAAACGIALVAIILFNDERGARGHAPRKEPRR
jgi:predicted unusual protein kinase regulating ubiquinone biosynthesis (AarF/ABC1/UbiB family)